MFDDEKDVVWLLILISLVWVKMVFWVYPRYWIAWANVRIVRVKWALRLWLVENGMWL